MSIKIKQLNIVQHENHACWEVVSSKHGHHACLEMNDIVTCYVVCLVLFGTWVFIIVLSSKPNCDSLVPTQVT